MNVSFKMKIVFLTALLVLPTQIAYGYLPRSYFPSGNQLAGLGLESPGLYKGFTDQPYNPSPDDTETNAYMNIYPINSVFAKVTITDETSTTEMDVKAYEMKYVVSIEQIYANYDIYDRNNHIIDQYPEQVAYGNGYLLTASGVMPQTGGAYLNQIIMYTKGPYFVTVQAHVHMAAELSGEQLTSLQNQAFTQLRNNIQSLAGMTSGNLGDQPDIDTGGGDTGGTDTGGGDTGDTTDAQGDNGAEKKSPLEILQQLQSIAISSINQLKQQAGQGQSTVTPNMKEFNEPDPEPKLSNGEPVSNAGKAKAENRKDKINTIGVGVDVEVVEVKTPSGVEVKVAPTVDPGEPSASLDPDLVFELKYQANKKIIEPLIDNLADKIAEKIPIISLYKDYFKADKDTNLFSDEEAVKKTSADLKVSEQAAKIYNDMSGIEDREKQMSPLKNSIPSNTMTKPFEYVIETMGTGVKKHVANGYRKEYEIAEKAALQYKSMGLSYSQIISNTIDDVADETAFNSNTQMLNAQSKGVYKNQSDRVGDYIIQMKDAGII